MISVAVFREYKRVRISLLQVEKIVHSVCRKEKVKTGRFSFVFLGDAKIRIMNKKFLGHNVVTDVITFPLENESIDAEIYINIQQAKRQARQYNVSFLNEVHRLIVHGVLHGLGYKDSTPRLRRKMFGIQERYVQDLSL